MGLCLCSPVVPTYSKTHSTVAHVPTEAIISPACVACDCPHGWAPSWEQWKALLEVLLLPVFGCGWGGLFSFLPFGVSPCCPVTD